MNMLTGELSTRNVSSSAPTSLKVSWKEVLWLVGLGAGIVILHAVLRVNLRLPGYHGLEWMALLVIGVMTSRYHGAATVSSITAAGLSLLPLFGLNDPFGWLTYLIPGLVLDAAYLAAARWQHHPLFLIALGGIAHATKP